VLRQAIRKRLQTKLNEVKAELQRRMHEPIPQQGKWLQAVVLRQVTGSYTQEFHLMTVSIVIVLPILVSPSRSMQNQ
jgi:hypothetical protein